MIVDTSFVIDGIDDIEPAVQKEQELETENVPLVIPSMTVLVLYIGVEKVANTRDECQTVEAMLDSYLVVDMTPSISRRAGRLLGKELGIGNGDAATALERDEPVLAGDSHFGNIPGVTHESYRC